MIHILEHDGHPLLGRLMHALRDVEIQRDRARFRSHLRQLGWVLGYELGRHLETREEKVATPLGTATVSRLERPPVLATVLRAGLALWEGVLDAFPDADVAILSAVRGEDGDVDPTTGKLPIEASYAVLTELAGRDLVWIDTMLATGSTLLALHPRVVSEAGTPRSVTVLGGIAWEPALQKLSDGLGARVIVGAADPTLNSEGFIVPGLGDAGDLAYGEPLRPNW